MSNVLSFNEALSVLEACSENVFKNKLWVPSLKREIAVKELTAKQQKNLLSAVLDSSTNKTKSSFVKAFFEILKENCELSLEELNNLTFIDRHFILLGLRYYSNPKIKINFSEQEEESVDLTELLNSIKNYNHPIPETLTLIKSNVEILVSITAPTLRTEVDYLSYNFNIPDTLSEEETLKALLAEAYILETSKYITDISIANNNLNFSKLSIKQKYTLIEKLPATITQSILERVTQWKEESEKYFTVKSSKGSKQVLDAETLLFLSN